MTAAARTTTLFGAALAAICAATSFAAPPAKMDVGRAAVVQSLSDCRKITEDAARLACYDKAAGALDQAESQGQVVVIDREQARAVRRQAFGFNLPSLNIFGRGAVKSEEGFDHLNLDIASVHHSSEGKWVFVATNGAVWRQTDSEEFAEDPHPGSKLFVHNGALGSFFCKVDGQPQVRCERVS
jgi:hypothetical protein